MWIIFGTSAQTRRIPGGLKVERRCDQCGETATFYEKELNRTFRLYFIDVFDYERHRVMACGCCGACYATDELGLPATPAQDDARGASFEDRIERASGRAVGYVERAATAFGDAVSGLFADERPARPASPPSEPPPSDVEEDLDPLEARFRELEKKMRVRTE